MPKNLISPDTIPHERMVLSMRWSYDLVSCNISDDHFVRQNQKTEQWKKEFYDFSKWAVCVLSLPTGSVIWLFEGFSDSEVDRGFNFASLHLFVFGSWEEWSMQWAVSLQLFCSFKLCDATYQQYIFKDVHQCLNRKVQKKTGCWPYCFSLHVWKNSLRTNTV